MFHVRTALELVGTAPETAWTGLPLFHEMEEKAGERRQAPNAELSHSRRRQRSDEAGKQRVFHNRSKQKARRVSAPVKS